MHYVYFYAIMLPILKISPFSYRAKARRYAICRHNMYAHHAPPAVQRWPSPSARRLRGLSLQYLAAAGFPRAKFHDDGEHDAHDDGRPRAPPHSLFAFGMPRRRRARSETCLRCRAISRCSRLFDVRRKTYDDDVAMYHASGARKLSRRGLILLKQDSAA